MLSSPTTTASQRDAVAPLESTGAGEAQSLVTASPAPVIITEQQVRFASAAVGVATHTAAVRRSWIVSLWQRLSAPPSHQREPRRSYPYYRSSYIEHAAMAREMERL